MKLLFSFKGRIGRQQWWLSCIGIAVVVVFLASLLIAILVDRALPLDMLDAVQQAIAAIMVFVHWLLTLPINVKRGHDRGRSGWWQLLGLIPLAYAWLLFDQGFLRGVDRTNEWGPPAVPRAARA